MRMLVVALLGTVGCGTGSTSGKPNNSGSSEVKKSTMSVANDANVAADSLVKSSAGIDIRVDGFGQLIVENHNEIAVQFLREVTIDMKTIDVKTGGGYGLYMHGMFLDEKCPMTEQPACVTVDANSTLRPMPWTGWFGCTQCHICDKNVPAPAGVYRFVVTSCDGKTTYTSGEVELDKPGHFRGAQQW
jgi:hypothetical protein